MDFKDYYAVLGVSPDADEQTIKQAYRTLARQYHPDVNPGDPQAEERFKEINEAYQALSDPERRRKYEELRQQYQRWQQRGERAPRGERGDFDWGQWQSAPGEREYSYGGSPEDMEDLFGGESPFSDFFSSMFGQTGGFGQAGGGRAQRTRESRPRKGRDIDADVEITLEEAFRGTTRSVQIGDRRIEARIPPGVRTGSRVRLAGQGSPGVAGGPAGDLYLNIEVLPNALFERDGDDLRVVVLVDFYTAAIGGEARVRTLDGEVKLKIPPRTQADRTFRLRGKGMPRLERPSERGDLYARIKLVLPEPLSDSELDTLRQLAQSRERVRG
jgi:curved DNA-binding protein